MILDRPDQLVLRVAVLFDSAGFLQTLPLTGAAAQTLHLNAALHARGCPIQLLLCDLNPDSRPSTAWPLPVSYLDYAEVYGRPDRLIARLRAFEPDLLAMSNTELTVRYGRAVADAAGAALVYEMHDDEAGMLASIGSRPADCRAAALLQGAAAVTADGVIAFTGRDAARAAALGARQVHLVPCGATVPHPRPRAKQACWDGPARVAFVGNLHYESNLRALRYLAAGLATVGTEEAFVGLDRPEQIALVSHDPTMNDLPELVDVLLDTPALRTELGARARERIVCHHGWTAVAGTAQHVDQVIAAAARASTSPHRGLHHRPVPREVAELARRPPYWLTEWRRRDPRLQDNAPMTEQTSAHAGESPQARAGGLAEDIDCARLAATAALGVSFDAQAAVGYAGRSMVFFAPDAVLKVYTHRPGERAHREVCGIELAAIHAPGVRVAEVLGHDDVPGGLSWVATTRLPGTPHPASSSPPPPSPASSGRSPRACTRSPWSTSRPSRPRPGASASCPPATRPAPKPATA
jgi:hypothetical protein